jgi:hypothetical protein
MSRGVTLLGRLKIRSAARSPSGVMSHLIGADLQTVHWMRRHATRTLRQVHKEVACHRWWSGLRHCTALDLAIVAELLPDSASVAKDLGMMNIAGALPFSLRPARIAPALAVGQVR